MKGIIFIFILLSLSKNLLAEAPPVVIKGDKNFYEIGLNLDILEDPKGKLTINDVNGPEWKEKFKMSQSKMPDFGFSKSTFWARLKVKNGDNPIKLFFVSDYYQQDYFSFFRKENGAWNPLNMGDKFKFVKRKIKSRSFVIPLIFKKEETFYFKIKGAYNRFDLKIINPESFIEREYGNTIIHGLFFGAIFLLTFYNLFIYLLTKELSYLLYVIWVFSFACLEGAMSGYGFQFFFGNFPTYSNEGTSFWGNISISSGVLFSISYLKIKDNSKIIYWSGLVLAFIALILSFLSLTIIPYNLSLILVNSLYLLACPFAAVASTSSLLRGYRPAIYYIIGGFAFIFGGIISASANLGMLPAGKFTDLAPLVGIIFMMGTFAIGLGAKVKELMNETIHSQRRALEAEKEKSGLQENYSKDLERLVKAKTRELEIEKMSIENMMDQTYEQKLARDQLLSNLGQGYLTFNKEGVVLGGATQVTEELLETSLFESEVEGLKIWDTLFKDQNKKVNFKKWVEKIFEAKFSFQDLKQLAPKSFEGTKDKHIELDFRPIYKEDSKSRIDKMIMIASDITHEVKLKKQLEKDKEATEFVNKCLQNPLEFVDLIFDSSTIIQDYKLDLKYKKSELFRGFHTLKARFGQFSLKSLTTLINDIETAISREKFEEMDSSIEIFDLEFKNFVKKNRLIVEAANKFLVEEGNAVQVPEIIKKAKEFGDINKYIDFVRSEYLLSDLKTKFERYIPLTEEIAERQGKSINFQISGDKVLVDTNRYSNFINSSIHLFRNMVDHGIESEDERIEKAKPQKGNIKVHFKLNSGDFEIILQDDGEGINPERVKEKAVKKGLKSEKDLSQVKSEEIVDLIFLPGLSTKEEVTEVSGRGIGMDAIRDEVKRLGGTISVSSEVDEGTTFVIKLPVFS